ncbi:hypothetical protein HDA40_002099 [Hamadaea flava]|uniref:Uncharacterized protein n=1 Tax=Hamadaea flava TaxID=1742688 RepID=A0ABV8LJJ4_9ACTN|nr:hypothetical protein [Hamadaea flava]MCP2323592.1 hypothetical protein [Hamadaea flava]
MRDYCGGGLLSHKSGSFGGGSANLGPWYYLAAPRYMCINAEAHYSSYTSQKDTDQVCAVLV